METNTLPIIFVIGSKENEPDRINYLEQYFKSEQVSVTYVQPWYKHTLTKDILQKYVPINESLHNRPLTMGEISLFLNHIAIFETILKDYTNGQFLIFESDAIFTDSICRYYKKISSTISQIPFDCISIGTGCNLVIPGISPDDTSVKLAQIKKTKCTDSLLWSYEGIQKFYSYFCDFIQKGKSINQPIDNFMDTFMNKDKTFLFYWIHPTICVQGSEHNIYKPSIRN